MSRGGAGGCLYQGFLNYSNRPVHYFVVQNAQYEISSGKALLVRYFKGYKAVDQKYISAPWAGLLFVFFRRRTRGDQMMEPLVTTHPRQCGVG